VLWGRSCRLRIRKRGLVNVLVVESGAGLVCSSFYIYIYIYIYFRQ